MEKLLSSEQINFVPGENTFGLSVVKEVWEVNGEKKIWWKYGLPDCVLIVAFTKDKKLIVIEEFQPLKDRLLQCIGGGVEENESPKEAAKRELLEETGYKAKHIELLTTIAENSGRSNRKIHYFLATDCEKTAKGEKGIKVVVLTPQKFWKKFYLGLISNPKITHDGAYTLQGVVLSFLHLGIKII